MRWTQVVAAVWQTPQELMQEGFRRGRVVMLNEAHDGFKRCVRTRQLGRRSCQAPMRWAPGIWLWRRCGPAEAANASRRPPDAAGGYLAQPRYGRAHPGRLGAWLDAVVLRSRPQHAPAALVGQGLGSQGFTNWREAEQARNLAAVLAGLPAGERLLVRCGDSHASKVAGHDWTPMGHHFTALVQEGPSSLTRR